jgi:hypothetical protein
VIAVTVHVHCSCREETFVTAAAGAVTISITAAALDAIEATLSDGREADRRLDGKGGYSAMLPCVRRSTGLRAWAAPGESYSDVILRLATAD